MGLHTVTSVLLVCSALSPSIPALYFDTCSAFLHASGFQGLVGSQISITEMRIVLCRTIYCTFSLSTDLAFELICENKSVYADSTLPGTKY